jgi:hypothetical protein
MAYPRYIHQQKRKITPEEVYKIDEKVVDEIEALAAMGIRRIACEFKTFIVAQILHKRRIL